MKTYQTRLLGCALFFSPLAGWAHPGPHEEVTTLPVHMLSAPDHLLSLGLIALIALAAVLIRRAVSGRGPAE